MNNEPKLKRIRVFRAGTYSLPSCENCTSYRFNEHGKGHNSRIVRVLANVPSDLINPMFVCVPCAKILKEMIQR